MAFLEGNLQFKGRLGNLLFYPLNGQTVCRTIDSSLSKRVKKDPRYKLFRMYSGFFRQASKIGSVIYKELRIRDVKIYHSIVGDAMCLFKYTAMNGDEVLKLLWEKWVYGVNEEPERENKSKAPEVTRDKVTKPVIEMDLGHEREHILKLRALREEERAIALLQWAELRSMRDLKIKRRRRR